MEDKINDILELIQDICIEQATREFSGTNWLSEMLQKIEEQGAAQEPVCSHTTTHLRPHVRTRTFWKNGQSFAGDKCYYDETEEQIEQLELPI